MIIGFIGFGKVAQNLVKLIDSKDIIFITSAEGRSSKTIENIENANLDVLDDMEQVVLKSDIVISANSPENALDVAKEYGEYAGGIFLDLNNVSPATIFEINNHVSKLVDGAIIGKVDSDNPNFYTIDGVLYDGYECSNNTGGFGDNVGDASMLKLLRSTYTKTLSALLIESSNLAEKYGLEEEFFEILSLTEGDDFNEKSKSRIKNTLNSKKRKSEELKQIIDYFDDGNLIMVKAAFEKFNQ